MLSYRGRDMFANWFLFFSFGFFYFSSVIPFSCGTVFIVGCLCVHPLSIFYGNFVDLFNK